MKRRSRARTYSRASASTSGGQPRRGASSVRAASITSNTSRPRAPAGRAATAGGTETPQNSHPSGRSTRTSARIVAAPSSAGNVWRRSVLTGPVRSTDRRASLYSSSTRRADFSHASTSGSSSQGRSRCPVAGQKLIAWNLTTVAASQVSRTSAGSSAKSRVFCHTPGVFRHRGRHRQGFVAWLRNDLRRVPPLRVTWRTVRRYPHILRRTLLLGALVCAAYYGVLNLLGLEDTSAVLVGLPIAVVGAYSGRQIARYRLDRQSAPAAAAEV
ncbi:hypothetical protein FHU40_005623 [Nocardioides soli]|uniref:Uncharacterized protein n=1 Tax=Nocardioides soli TaxID=1036020 RepID=A0A7W4W254_9ACTN|nr:hypothetical protein [Nocardioides soli]MBB3045763.1 hypothetical protein [Nocardioides soli]